MGRAAGVGLAGRDWADPTHDDGAVMDGAPGERGIVSAMDPDPYKVIVVVDRAFGKQLESIPRGVSVWIVDSNSRRFIPGQINRAGRPSN